MSAHRADRQDRRRDGARGRSSPRWRRVARGRARRFARVRGARPADAARRGLALHRSARARSPTPAPLAPRPTRRASPTREARSRSVAALGATRLVLVDGRFVAELSDARAGRRVAGRRRAEARPRRSAGRRCWRSTARFAPTAACRSTSPAGADARPRSRSCISMRPGRASACACRARPFGRGRAGDDRRALRRRGAAATQRNACAALDLGARRQRLDHARSPTTAALHLESAGRAARRRARALRRFRARLRRRAGAAADFRAARAAAAAKIALAGLSLIDGERHADTTLDGRPRRAARREPRVLPPYRRRRGDRRLSGQGDRRPARAEDRRRHEDPGAAAVADRADEQQAGARNLRRRRRLRPRRDGRRARPRADFLSARARHPAAPRPRRCCWRRSASRRSSASPTQAVARGAARAAARAG